TYDPDNSTLFLVCPAGVAQPGPVIYKSTGELVWADPTLGGCDDLNYQTFEGEGHLTLWVGSGLAGSGAQVGSGFALILNNQYEVIRNISAVNPDNTDLHEFKIPGPNNDTALLTAYNPVPLDLSSIGGPVDGWYLNSLIQEVDIATGRVIFNWSSVDHIALTESFNNITISKTGTSQANPWDAVHINSIDKDSAGNYLISSRHCKTIYKISRNGTIIWRLGGHLTDFTPIGNETFFNWQHHARWRNNETQISLFDDGAAVLPGEDVVNEVVASGKFLIVDEAAMTVELAKRYLPSPSKFVSCSYFRALTEPYGDTVVVGYGLHPWVTVHDASTQDVIFSAVIGPNASVTGVSNYRVFQTSTDVFVGRPSAPPSVAIVNGNTTTNNTTTTIYVSWNGATHVASYTVLTGDNSAAVERKVVNVPKSGFETAVSVSTESLSAYVVVEALDAGGRVLGRS
ncbi:ASST-domain-containing protein, partial [Mycena metata]